MYVVSIMIFTILNVAALNFNLHVVALRVSLTMLWLPKATDKMNIQRLDFLVRAFQKF